MHVVFVILLLNRIISAENSSEERFIDLLPEKEKQEFLEKIARRIFSGIESKDDRDGVSREVSDTELDSQSAFVNQILKEESRDLRKNGVKTEKVDDLDQDIDKKDTFDKNDATDNTKLVDLTLRDNVRDKRNSLTNIDEDSKIVRINVSNVETKEKDHEEDENKDGRSGSDREDIQIKNFPRPSVRNLNELDMIESTTTNFDAENERDYLRDNVSQSKSDESDKNEKPLEIELDRKDDNTQKATNVEHNEGYTKKTIDSQENNDDQHADRYKDSTNEKELHKTTQNKSDIILDVNDEYANKVFKKEDENSSNKKGSIPLASESTSVNEPTTDIKQTIHEIEKSTNSDNITEANENIRSKTRSVRSNTESTNLEQNKTNLKKDSVNESRNDFNTEIVSVAVDNVNNANSNDMNKNDSNNGNHEDPENIKPELVTKITDESNSEKENHEKPDNTHPEISTSLINSDKEYSEDKTTTEKIIDTTTIKTEALTKASMRAGKESFSLDYSKDHPVKHTEKNTPRDTNNNINNKKHKRGKKVNLTNKKSIKKKKSGDDVIDKNSVKFINDIIKVLRDKLKQNTYDNELKMKPLNKALKQEKYMNVYELPADKKHFINEERINKNKENPFYVPIYNYSPDNAYYNPHNKFGPNANDNNDDIINHSEIDGKYYENNRKEDKINNKKDSVEINHGGEEKEVTGSKYNKNLKDIDPVVDKLIKGYTKYRKQRKFKFGNRNRFKTHKSRYKTQNYNYKPNLPIVVKYPKFTDIILNPNDYLDMDYNNDRKQETPNIRSKCDDELPKDKNKVSKEEEGAVSNEDKDTNNLKSRIRVARQWLYDQKMFGYIPPITTKPNEMNTEESKNVLRSNEDIKDDNKSIAMDYYFGKSDRFETDTENYENDKGISRNDENNPATLYHEKEFELRSNKQMIKETFSLYETKDLSALRPTNLNTRSNELDTYVDVLKDMVENNAKSLKQFDWLGTTVDLQSALYKFKELIDAVRNNNSPSHPDLQLLKYSIYLHKTTKNIKNSRRAKMLPRNRKKRRGFIKDSGLINRHWLMRVMAQNYDIIITKRDFDDFNDFLNDLQYYLFDLHTAVQKIANITNYKNQNWFENLKELYLDTTRKNLLEVLLHVTSTRLLDLIEKAAQNGVEEDYLTFVINNEKEVERTNLEMAFVLQIIEELNK